MADGHIEKKMELDTYFASTDKNREVLKNTKNFGMRLNT